MRDRVEGQLREATGHLLIIRQLIGGGAGAGWNMAPAKLGPDQLDVVLRRGPGGEGPGGVLLGAGGGHAKRPGPEPTRIGLVAHRRQGVARVGRRVAGEVAGPDGGVVPHGGLAAVIRIQALAEAGVGGGRLAGGFDQIDVKVDGLLELWLRQLRVPLLIEPFAAKGIDDRVQRSELLAPTRKAAEADSGDTLARIVDLVRGGRDLVPCRRLRQRHSRRLEEVLAIHEKRRFGVEGDRVEASVVGERLGHARNQVVRLVGGRLLNVGGQILNPAVFCPQRNLVGPDHAQVEPAAMCGNVLGDLLAELVFRQDHKLDLDVRMRFLKFGDQLLQV